MVSISSPHFFNWAAQLEGSGHDVFWLDVLDSRHKVERIKFVNHINGWRYRWNYPGRYFVKKKIPRLNKAVNIINERKLGQTFEKVLKQIQPNVVHSFVMYLSCVPILEVMWKNPQIKWLYSSWGSDLFYYRNCSKKLAEIQKVLPRVDFMFSDCYRDFLIAKNLGFKGKLLGVFPGRGGFDFNETDHLILPFKKRNKILIKGFEGKHGRCINVLKAIKVLEKEVSGYEVVVFGADKEVVNFVSQSSLDKMQNFSVRKRIPHLEVLKLMGQAMLYIGNSSSDGLPNTLLEAIIMGAYPIQSNPGGATAEIVEHGKNGLLIQNPEDPDEIFKIISEALTEGENLEKKIEENLDKIKPRLERNHIKKQVLERYQLVEEMMMQSDRDVDSN